MENIISNTRKILRPCALAALTLALLAAVSAKPASAAVTYLVTVNTSSISGVSGNIDLQFNPGGASQLATAQVLSFSGATLAGAPSVTGDVTGTLPGTLTFDNLTAFNDYFQPVTFGSSFSFVVVLSGPAISAPNHTSTSGSAFTVSLYNAAGTVNLLTNQNLGGGQAGELDINLDGTVTATAFPSSAAGVTPVLPSVVTFSQISPDGYQTLFATNLNVGDSYVNVTNSGANGAGQAAGTTASITGSICVNAYVFAPDEQLMACCSCPVTPNGVSTLSVLHDLVGNALEPQLQTTAVSISLTATAPANGTCNGAAFAPLNTAPAAPGLVAWGSTLHANTSKTPAFYEVTEARFELKTLSVGESTRLTSLCQFVNANGSGPGICNSCQPGALAAGKK